MALKLDPKTLEKYPSLQKVVAAGPGNFKESHDGREERLLAYIESRATTEPLQNNPTLILQAMDDFAATEDFLINIGSDKARILADTIAEHKPHVLLELGGYVAYSAIFFADRMRRYDQSAHVWSLEFEPKFIEIMEKLIALAGLESNISVIMGPADQSMRMLKKTGKVEHVDLLFLDHVESLYEQDLKIALDELRLLKKGALILADNVAIPGAPVYRELVRSRQDLTSEGIPALIVPGDLKDEIEKTVVL